MHMMNLLTIYLSVFARECADVARQRVSVASSLMERADACAGRDPTRAADLRSAAMAYLGVVR
jgi:hypothetical protein